MLINRRTSPFDDALGLNEIVCRKPSLERFPKSNPNLFMLVSALMGRERMQSAYAHAIAAGYRFYSYGDSSLLLP